MKDKRIAVFCGGLKLPFLVVDSLRENGWSVLAVGLRGFYDSALKTDMVVRLGGGGAAIREMKRRGITQMCFVGAIGHPNLSDIRPDLFSLGILAKIAKNAKGYDSMSTALIAELQRRGFRVVAAQDICPDLTLDAGIHTRTRPSKSDQANCARAIAVSHMIGREDIGQSVAVDGAVLAVEAAEGTAKMLERVAAVHCGKKKSGVFAKMTKPGQNLKIDIPAIGVDTVNAVADAGLHGIVINAKTCFVIDRAAVIATANRRGIFISAV
ncbi:MAG: UDP-2,3-diacylglucosamine diphosphatase LpxI [Rickettsiales bacterium]|jgi:DUF1009 family protein|nr:UDP-2,3-diacylglucosamine diphosphatase LpxI [Rickettsiales bacterium]